MREASKNVVKESGHPKPYALPMQNGGEAISLQVLPRL